jgi:hypothetical protein
VRTNRSTLFFSISRCWVSVCDVSTTSATEEPAREAEGRETAVAASVDAGAAAAEGAAWVEGAEFPDGATSEVDGAELLDVRSSALTPGVTVGGAGAAVGGGAGATAGGAGATVDGGAPAAEMGASVLCPRPATHKEHESAAPRAQIRITCEGEKRNMEFACGCGLGALLDVAGAPD